MEQSGNNTGNPISKAAGPSRRDLLKVGGAAAAVGTAAIASRGWMNGGPAQPAGRYSAYAAELLNETIVKTTCDLCPSGCGLDVRVVAGRAVKIEGNPLHPLNQGVCCLKAQTALEVLYSPERIAHPRIQMGERGSGDWKEISWEEALEIAARKLKEMRSAGLAHTLALLHGDLRGQMRSLVSRFMEAYGSPNLIARDSLGEAAVRQTVFLMQGVKSLPVYDLTNASYVMAFGGNLLEAGRSLMGSFGATAFMRRGRPQRGKLVAVHPRLGLTGMKADEWVPVRPGTYGALALGMANVIINSGLYDADFIRDFTFGFEDFEDENGTKHTGFKNLVLETYPIDRVASITGVPSETIARLAGEFATNRPAVALLPTEAGELGSGNSLYTAMAVYALNALVGSIDTAGGVLVQRYPTPKEWPAFTPDDAGSAGLTKGRVDGAGTPAAPLAASIYQNLARNILAEDPYPITALFLLNANPVYELPNAGQFLEALAKVPFVVSFASTLDESAAHADLILPASTFLEVWGDDYLEGTGYAGLSLRRPVVEPVRDTRSPGDVLLQLANLLDGPVAEALPWNDYLSLVKYRLEAVDMEWDKFEANGCWSEMVYFNAAPGSPAWSKVVGRDRLYAPKDGRFDFFSRELFALTGQQESGNGLGIAPADLACLPHFEMPLTLQQDAQEAAEYPLLLVSQSLITQSANWQGIIPTLQEAYGLQTYTKWKSWVEMNPRVAEALHLEEDDRVWVESSTGRVQAVVRLYEGLWPNVVFMPGGQGHHTFVRWGRHSPAGSVTGSNTNLLITAGTEPLSGNAILSPTRVRIIKA